jgi:hypothetical protein
MLNDHVVAQRAQRRRVALFGLQPPHEAGRALGEGVDAVEVGDEVGHRRRLERLLHHRDIQLRELILGHGGSS